MWMPSKPSTALDGVRLRQNRSKTMRFAFIAQFAGFGRSFFKQCVCNERSNARILKQTYLSTSLGKSINRNAPSGKSINRNAPSFGHLSACLLMLIAWELVPPPHLQSPRRTQQGRTSQREQLVRSTRKTFAGQKMRKQKRNG